MNSKHFVLGGDINKSLTEGYRFDFKKLFQDAINITRKHFTPLLIACVLILSVFTLLLSLLIDDPTFLSDPAFLNNPSVMGAFFALTLLVAPPLMTGLLMMGVHHSIGLKTKPFYLFNYFNLTLKLSLAAMMMMLLTNAMNIIFSQLMGGVGAILSVIVLLYFKMSFCLVYPLIAEKKVSPLLALKLSFKLVHKNIGQFTQLLIIFCVLFLVGLVTSGIGLLFIIPFYINVMGIIYRQICGVSVSMTEASESDGDNNIINTNDDDHSGPRSGGFEA